MKRSPFYLSALACIMFPGLASAQNDLNYSYIEIDYVIQNVDLYEDDDIFEDIDEDIDDGDGFKISGSWAFTPNFFALASYSNTEADFSFRDDVDLNITAGQDIKTLKLGLGYNLTLSNTTDFVASASYIDVDYGEFSLGADDDEGTSINELQDAYDDLNEDTTDGFSIDLGVRSDATDWLEAGVGVRYTDIDTGDSFGLIGNLLFKINPNMGVNLTADVDDMLSTYGLGFRYSFGSTSSY